MSGKYHQPHPFNMLQWRKKVAPNFITVSPESLLVFFLVRFFLLLLLLSSGILCFCFQYPLEIFLISTDVVHCIVHCNPTGFHAPFKHNSQLFQTGPRQLLPHHLLPSELTKLYFSRSTVAYRCLLFSASGKLYIFKTPSRRQ